MSENVGNEENTSLKGIQKCSRRLGGVKKANLPFVETPEVRWVGKATVFVMAGQRFPHSDKLSPPPQDLRGQVRVEP